MSELSKKSLETTVFSPSIIDPTLDTKKEEEKIG